MSERLEGAIPVIDSSVHIFFRDNADLRSYLREPFASRGFPDYEMDWYGAPGGEYAPGTRKNPGSYPGSDPEFVGHQLFETSGVEVAVLHPMSRGIMPDRHLGTALLSAHNQMMVERWLESGTYHDRFRGTLRVNPDDVTGALREIERWRGHPQIVQLGVPLQSRDLYGKPQYRPLWAAAAEAGLPVAVHIEVGNSATAAPTPHGPASTYSQYLGFMGLNYVYHLLNMIAEGVFEELPDFKVVWADGGADLLTPFIWRMDTFGRPHLEQTPWAPRMPSDYLPGHVYFVHSSIDGPDDADGPEGAGEAGFASDWLRMTGKENMLLFGSSYPHWQLTSPGDLPAGWTREQREGVLWRNAAALYGIDIGLTTTTA